jgi:hypothetical protein
MDPKRGSYFLYIEITKKTLGTRMNGRGGHSASSIAESVYWLIVAIVILIFGGWLILALLAALPKI